MQLSKFSLLALFILSGSLQAAPSYESFSSILKNKNYQLKLSNSYFQTTAFYDHDGVKQNLGSRDNYTRMENELLFRRSFTKHFEAGVFGRYRQQNSEEADIAGTMHSNSASGIESVGFQFRHAFLPVQKLRYTLEGGARLVAYKNSEYDTTQPYKEIMLGDGVNELFAGGAVSYESKSNNVLTGRVHLNYPTSRQSSELKYDTQGALVWEKIALLAGVGGIYSLNQDKYSSDKTAKPRRYTGATRMYNSINRSYVAPYIGLNFTLGSQFRVETKATSIVMANSYDQGNEYSVNFVYNSNKADNTAVVEKDDKFKTYNIEASVVKVSPRSKFIRIDKGIAQDVEKGMRADVFEFDYLGGNKLLASGVVMEVAADAAVVKLLEIYQQADIKVGHVVRLQEL